MIFNRFLRIKILIGMLTFSSGPIERSALLVTLSRLYSDATEYQVQELDGLQPLIANQNSN